MPEKLPLETEIRNVLSLLNLKKEIRDVSKKGDDLSIEYQSVGREDTARDTRGIYGCRGRSF